MSRLDWLPDVLRDAGVDIWMSPGAETRGRADIDVNGIVWHHTATGTNWSDTAVHALLRDGRRDLAGPLYQVGIERDGTWVIIALGRANHNGYGEWGNDSIGLGFYNKGDNKDPWTTQQVNSGFNGTAAILRHLGLGVGRVKGHKETDPRRKIDPAGLLMDGVRYHIDVLLNSKQPTPIQTTPEDPDMTYIIIPESDGGGIVLLHAGKIVAIAGPAGLGAKIETWDLRNDPATWTRLKKAYGDPIK